MKINIEYFASMREKTGLSKEVVNTDAVTALELFEELMKRYDFSLSTEDLKLAVNEEYKPFSTKLNEDDTIVFIPPVAGG